MILFDQIKPLTGQLLKLNDEVRVKTTDLRFLRTLVGSREHEEITQFICKSEQLVADIENATSVLSDHLKMLKAELDI